MSLPISVRVSLSLFLNWNQSFLRTQITAHVVPHYVIFNLFRPEALDRTVAVISPIVL